MTTTLRNVLPALGLISAQEQREFVASLAEAGAFGEDDRAKFAQPALQDALLQQIRFESPEQAVAWLTDATKDHKPHRETKLCPLSIAHSLLEREGEGIVARLSAADAVRHSLENLRMVKVAEIGVDADAMQYRLNADGKSGVKNKAAVEQPYHPLTFNPPLLFEYEDGRIVVVDGHHRIARLSAAKARGEEVPESIPAYVLREREGVSPETARAVGAAVNFAEDAARSRHATVDPARAEEKAHEAARVFHDIHAGRADPVFLPPLPLDGKLRDAYDAGRLSPAAFRAMEEKGVPVAIGAELARQSTAETPDTQARVMALIANQHASGAWREL